MCEINPSFNAVCIFIRQTTQQGLFNKMTATLNHNKKRERR